jgi:hypothetical protein
VCTTPLKAAKPIGLIVDRNSRALGLKLGVISASRYFRAEGLLCTKKSVGRCELLHRGVPAADVACDEGTFRKADRTARDFLDR